MSPQDRNTHALLPARKLDGNEVDTGNGSTAGVALETRNGGACGASDLLRAVGGGIGGGRPRRTCGQERSVSVRVFGGSEAAKSQVGEKIWRNLKCSTER